MFKKTLIALSVVSAFGVTTAANAATLAFGAAKTVSVTGNLAATGGAATLDEADLGTVAINIGTNYNINDLVVFTVSGATFNTTIAATATNTDGGSATAGVLTFVDYSDANTVRFRVDGTNAEDTDTLTLATYDLITTGAADAGTITMSSKAVSLNPAIGDYDASTAAALGATFRAQYSSAVTAFNEVVDVSAGRQEFVGGTADAMVATPTNNSGDLDAITIATVTHVLTATDLSFAMDYDLVANGGNGNGTLSQAELDNAFTITTAGGTDDTYTSSLNAAMNTLTIVQTFDTELDTMTVTANVVGEAGGGSVILAPQSFTLASTAANAGSAIVLPTDSGSAGSWTLNGANVTIPYMPFGDNTQVISRITNTSSVSGGLSVRYMLEGVNTTWVDLGELSTVAGGVTDIAPLIIDAVKADAGVTKGKVTLDITVNVPSTAVTVFAAYKVLSESDRGFVGTFGANGSANN